MAFSLESLLTKYDCFMEMMLATSTVRASHRRAKRLLRMAVDASALNDPSDLSGGDSGYERLDDRTNHSTLHPAPLLDQVVREAARCRGCGVQVAPASCDALRAPQGRRDLRTLRRDAYSALPPQRSPPLPSMRAACGASRVNVRQHGVLRKLKRLAARALRAGGGTISCAL